MMWTPENTIGRETWLRVHTATLHGVMGQSSRRRSGAAPDAETRAEAMCARHRHRRPVQGQRAYGATQTWEGFPSRSWRKTAGVASVFHPPHRVHNTVVDGRLEHLGQVGTGPRSHAAPGPARSWLPQPLPGSARPLLPARPKSTASRIPPLANTVRVWVISGPFLPLRRDTPVPGKPRMVPPTLAFCAACSSPCLTPPEPSAHSPLPVLARLPPVFRRPL